MVSSRRKPSGRDEADLVLTPGWGKLAKVTFTGLLFVGAGLFILKTGGPWYVGGLVIASGGLGIAIIAVNHLPGASFLRLEDDGFRYASLFRQHFIPWANITQFVVARIANRTLVGWNYIVPKSRLYPRADCPVSTRRTRAAMPPCRTPMVSSQKSWPISWKTGAPGLGQDLILKPSLADR